MVLVWLQNFDDWRFPLSVCNFVLLLFFAFFVFVAVQERSRIDAKLLHLGCIPEHPGSDLIQTQLHTIEEGGVIDMQGIQ